MISGLVVVSLAVAAVLGLVLEVPGIVRDYRDMMRCRPGGRVDMGNRRLAVYRRL